MDVKNWRKALGVGLMTAAAITNSSAYAASTTVTVDVNVPTILVMYHYSTITLNLDSTAVADYLTGIPATGCGGGECYDNQGAVAVAVSALAATNTISQPVTDLGPGSTTVSFTLEDSVGVRAIGCGNYIATQADAGGSSAGITIPGMALAGIDGGVCSFGMTTGDLSFDMDFAAVPANPVSAIFAVTITGL